MLMPMFALKSFIIFYLELLAEFFTDLRIRVINQWYHSQQVFSAISLFFTISVISNWSMLTGMGTGFSDHWLSIGFLGHEAGTEFVVSTDFLGWVIS